MMRPRRPIEPLLMLAPTCVLLVLFFFYPLLFAFKNSFYSWDLLTPERFVGIGNYTSLWNSGELLGVLLRTLGFSVVTVMGTLGLGLGLALLLNRPGRFAAIARGAVFSAYVVSWVSVGLLWMLLLDQEVGLVNRGLNLLGVSLAPNWLGDPGLALYTLGAITIWKLGGYGMILFLAGLQDIPPSYYEAASLDGATPVEQFRHVTWPLLRPTFAFVGTTSLIVSFQSFDVVRIMTQGGPIQSTTVFVYAIYEQIFENLRVGRASALVVVFFFVLLALTALQLKAWQSRSAT